MITGFLSLLITFNSQDSVLHKLTSGPNTSVYIMQHTYGMSPTHPQPKLNLTEMLGLSLTEMYRPFLKGKGTEIQFIKLWSYR